MLRKVQMSFTRKSVHQNIFYLLLGVLVCAMPTSKFLMSAMMIFLAANWVIECRFREKWEMAKSNKVLWAFVVLYVIHAVWCLFSSNWDYALDDLRKKLPLLVIPLVVLTSDFLNRRKIALLLHFFCLTVAVASVVGIIRHFGNPDMDYRNMFPHFSHIRFALNVCLAMVVLFYVLHKLFHCKKLRLRWLRALVIVLLMTIYCIVLLLLQSYTAFVILTVVFVVLLGWMAIRRRSQLVYPIAFFAVLTMVVLAAWFCFSHYRSNYYTLSDLSTKPLTTHTAQGNAYTHANDGLIEMGNYINNYVCDTELRCQWAKRSTMDIDSLTPNTFAVYPTLVRYLNAKGLTKDSTGVWQLTDNDIALIEQGVANPHYASNFGLGKMFYRIFFDYECYKKTGRVKNSSFFQRLTLWQNGWEIFVSHPVLGVGTGDVADEVEKNLSERHSELAGTGMRTHNQLITFLFTFGIVGFAIITLVFVWAVKKHHLLKSAVFVAYLCIVLVSFLGEDTLETEAGVVFFTLMFSLLSQWAQASADGGESPLDMID
ncbi:MAG: O-antigen ligase family protein [Bacteroidales bacterium]|nr:O-antigen ligase family protein [Bacteroidales bacterium]